MSQDKPAILAGIGKRLRRHELDVERCILGRTTELALSEDVQYAAPHPSQPVLYAACSDRTSHLALGKSHSVQAVRFAGDGGMAVFGRKAELPYRPINITTDSAGRHVLVAFNKPADLWIFRINEDGSLGDRVVQRQGLDFGIFPHEVQVTPDDRLVILVTRGNADFEVAPRAHVGDQAEPGALKVFEFRDGVLGSQVTVVEGTGHRFGARNLAFHPSAPWIYVSLETQNELLAYGREGDALSAHPASRQNILANPATPHHQGAGALQVHPDGRTLYAANRGHRPMAIDGKKVVVDGENSLVVFDLEKPGQPRLVQRIDAHGMCPRTFSLDPSGRVMVVANAEKRWVRQGDQPVRWVPANLALFRVQSDGRLEFEVKHDIELTGTDAVNWMGVVTL